MVAIGTNLPHCSPLWNGQISYDPVPADWSQIPVAVGLLGPPVEGFRRPRRKWSMPYYLSCLRLIGGQLHSQEIMDVAGLL